MEAFGAVMMGPSGNAFVASLRPEEFRNYNAKTGNRWPFFFHPSSKAVVVSTYFVKDSQILNISKLITTWCSYVVFFLYI